MNNVLFNNEILMKELGITISKHSKLKNSSFADEGEKAANTPNLKYLFDKVTFSKTITNFSFPNIGQYETISINKETANSLNSLVMNYEYIGKSLVIVRLI